MSDLIGFQDNGVISFLFLGIVSIVIIVLIVIIILQANELRRIKNQINKSNNEPIVNENNDVGKSDIDIDTLTCSQRSVRDEEIVAAITAALCEYTKMSNTDFKIKSIKRVSGIDSAWRRSGII